MLVRINQEVLVRKRSIYRLSVAKNNRTGWNSSVAVYTLFSTAYRKSVLQIFLSVKSVKYFRDWITSTYQWNVPDLSYRFFLLIYLFYWFDYLKISLKCTYQWWHMIIIGTNFSLIMLSIGLTQNLKVLVSFESSDSNKNGETHGFTTIWNIFFNCCPSLKFKTSSMFRLVIQLIQILRMALFMFFFFWSLCSKYWNLNKVKPFF